MLTTTFVSELSTLRSVFDAYLDISWLSGLEDLSSLVMMNIAMAFGEDGTTVDTSLKILFPQQLIICNVSSDRISIFPLPFVMVTSMTFSLKNLRKRSGDPAE